MAPADTDWVATGTRVPSLPDELRAAGGTLADTDAGAAPTGLGLGLAGLSERVAGLGGEPTADRWAAATSYSAPRPSPPPRPAPFPFPDPRTLPRAPRPP
ncbi:hypothetical protein Voc01_030840 [Virgisporangium ochraceum]|uniref:Uncharacterized protein n=1 Tax=Virgisporangium ochraceum TaxID=65505 RepID=A0A8J3ZSG7_9ACTN|nr:hypothetical protein Voc01_030840 [Virgisporangium ochraceum]